MASICLLYTSSTDWGFLVCNQDQTAADAGYKRQTHPLPSIGPVSYTHLDVYKRQGLYSTSLILASLGSCHNNFLPYSEII